MKYLKQKNEQFQAWYWAGVYRDARIHWLAKIINEFNPE